VSVPPGPAAQPATGSTESQPTTGRFATWRSGARNRVREVYAPIRVRLISLILLAAVPLVLLAATIAWQNYTLALGVSSQAVSRLRESAIARHAAALEGAQQMMQALAELPELLSTDPQRCHDRLAGILDLQRRRYSNVAFFNPDGTLHCSGRPLVFSGGTERAEALNKPLFAQAAAARSLVLGSVRLSRLVDGNVIPAAYAVRHSGAIVGFLYAGLRMDWFTAIPGSAMPALPALWLVDPGSMVTPLADAPDSALPPPAVMKRLLAQPDEIDARSRSGQPYAYASSGLTGGYRLLIAYPASDDLITARGVLINRALQLALFTLLGLSAVAIGANGALVAPLNALDRKVQDWRRTGTFDGTDIAAAPLEVRALCSSFHDAALGLAEQAARLDKAAEKQALLMREIHHRVKNNLQIVASLLNLQAARIRAPEARAEFAAARDRVRALATLHRHLYSQGELTSIEMSSFLTELCGQLLDAMGERRGGRINLTIEAIDLEMSGDQAVPLSLVVTEAVSNAIKYAFPAGRSGNIGVYLTSDGAHARLMIEDDGVGIPAGRVETETGTRDGLGLQLIRGFSKQLKGDLVVEHEHGTRYTLTIPLVPAAE
jgi:two-component sensor histidine kinase